MTPEILAYCLADREQSRQSWNHAHSTAPRLIAKWCNDNRIAAPVTAEIGVAYGDMSAAILRAVHPIRHIAIDPYRERLEYVDSMNAPQEVQWCRMALAWHHLWTTAEGMSGHRPIVEMHPRLELAVGRFPHVIFIDGDHSYEGVRDDLSFCATWIHRDGLLCGHDYGDPGWPGVTKAVHEFADKHGLRVVAWPGRCWAIQT
jgi:hypothetical protein